jgi:hypothetical protein
MKQDIIIEGSPARLIEALSHIGYSLQSSVCDLVDNSISHGKAKNIFVIFDYDPDTEKFVFLIYDDGSGMSESGLKNAMKFGSSDEHYDTSSDLGKFGMGLKTASLAHCENITVASKTKSGRPAAVTLDKHTVRKSDKWKYLQYSGKSLTEKISESREVLGEFHPNRSKLFHSGTSYTVVQWGDLIELDKRAQRFATEGHKYNWIERIQGIVECHLRMVFHRFIDGDYGARRTNIFYNGEKLSGWSPLCEDISTRFKTGPEPDEGMKFTFEEGEKPLYIRRYILPKKDDNPEVFLTDRSQNDKVMKIEKWQGLFFYRNNRLIDYGGWYDGTGTEPHATYARASVDLTSEHDRHFTLNVNKTLIKSFDSEFRVWLKENMPSLRSEAKKRIGKKKVKITNSLRTKEQSVGNIISEEAREKNINVKRIREKQIRITNSYGSFFEKEIAKSKGSEKLLKERIGASNLGDSQLLWRMIPDGKGIMQVEINTENELYKTFYTEQRKNRRVTAVIDAMLIGLAFSEINCKTEKSKEVFEDINRTVGHLLNRLIESEIIK